MFIMLLPMGDLGAQHSFIFSQITERVTQKDGREKEGLCLLRCQQCSSSLFVITCK